MMSNQPAWNEICQWCMRVSVVYKTNLTFHNTKHASEPSSLRLLESAGREVRIVSGR
jgi:hypothetical protein